MTQLPSSKKGCRRPSRKLPWPKRGDVAILCFLGLLVATCDRANISVAAPAIMREYGWGTTKMGAVFSAFYISYISFMVPAGIFADRLGPKRVFAFGMACWSAFTALTSLPRSLTLLLTVRACMGAGESATLPAMNAILARWFPPNEYSRTTALSWSGGYAGVILAFPLASLILRDYGWRTIFYVFGGLGAVWLVLWYKAAHDRPEDCPNIDCSELEVICSSRPPVSGRRPIPWSLIVQSPQAWAVFALHFSSNWFTYFLISWLPTYLLVDRHFSLSKMAWGSSLPFVCALGGTNVFGHMIDRMSRRRSRTRVSKMFLLSFAAAAGILMLISKVTSPSAIVILLCIAAALMTGATPVYASGSLDLVPSFAGSFVGVQNSIANLSGVLAPVITGYLAASKGWSAAFSCTAAVSVFGIAFYLLVGKAERADLA
jgi:sugar phosphate permease